MADSTRFCGVLLNSFRYYRGFILSLFIALGYPSIMVRDGNVIIRSPNDGHSIPRGEVCFALAHSLSIARSVWAHVPYQRYTHNFYPELHVPKLP